MTPYTEQLDRIKANLALVESVFARYPELFSCASVTSLDCEIPRVKWWRFNSTLDRRLALAIAHKKAEWKRDIDASDRVHWSAVIAGVEFVLEDMEPAKANGGPVVFDQVSEMIQLAHTLVRGAN